MAIAADFLSAPKFNTQTTSFLAGKVSNALVNKGGLSLSEATDRLLGTSGRYATDLSSTLGSSEQAGFTLRRDVLGYNPLDEMHKLVEAQSAIAKSLMPANFKVNPKLIDALRRVQDYDDDALVRDYFGDYTEEQLAKLRQFGDATLGGEGRLYMYSFMAKHNKLPTPVFYKPVTGTSGLPGTAGTGYKNLQQGFSDRLLAAIADANRQGARVTINWGWRSLQRQKELRKEKPSMAAVPGYSNHGWGLAADLGFRDRKSRDIMHSIAAKYGLRFPMSYEPWHIEPAVIKGIAGNKRVYEPKQWDIFDAYAALVRQLETQSRMSPTGKGLLQ